MTSRKNSAFTLIELLVVICIIGVLAALLLPALGRAKRAALQADCANTSRQWGIGIILYAEEHETLPRERGAPNANRWAVVSAQTNGNVWYNAVPALAGFLTASNYATSPELFYSSAKMFMCPAARPNPEAGMTNALFPRGMNARLVIGQTPSRLDQIVDPSSTALFVEAGVPGEKEAPSQYAFDGRPHVKWERTSTRHEGGGNVTFGDGHGTMKVATAELTNEFPRTFRWNIE